MIIFSLLATIGKVMHGDSDDEIELMKRIQAGHEDALEELYELYKRLLFGMILSIVKKKEVAEDVLQEVFITVWDKAGSFDKDRGNVYSWILTLARNKAIDRIRSKSYKSQEKASVSIHDPFFTLEGDKFDPLETTIFSNRAELVKRALQEIPEAQRRVIHIAYYRGLTQSEIANHLDIPLGTVKTRTRQGMIKLQRILGDYIN
ncbi:sigma-70 family RNA polymerase sigma factor [Fodinibius sediminis]|uniref:RNA polymerase sigma-70 factor, ECF subfamily n=1 Tax=Fodinibius sediminis TaxID=1214077 RepID=A0A521E2C3_9BACT|nr:sigma-70 family RNA polymerase sigma factor [Fodinibius sediminis]SMO77461.1 RNA polymerase sigma-70 factor, ECF subfamily [Fodinibius sediminis]